MKTLVNVLQEICHSFPTKRKIIIVDSYSIGEDILDAYIKKGKQAINLTYRTIRDLAMEYLELSAKEPCQFLDSTLGVHFTYQILKKLKEKGEFSYFNDLEITPAFSHAIFQTIQNLRLAGVTSSSLKVGDFLSPNKGEDLIKILFGFEELFTKMNLLDDAAIYQQALEVTLSKSSSIYVLQSNITLSPLEEKFLERLLTTPLYKLPLEQVHGVIIPERSSLRSISWGKANPLSFLYQQKDRVVEMDNLSVFSAKTAEMEVKNVLLEIITKQTKLDDAVVYYTNSDPYVMLFYHFYEKSVVPITFGEGIPLSISRPGLLVAGLIKWVQSNYQVPVFLDILNEGLLELAEDAPSRTRIAKLLRNAQIGWTMERYDLQMEKELNRLREKINETQDMQLIEAYEKNIHELSWLKLWFKRLFSLLPVSNRIMDYQALLKGIVALLTKHCQINSALDQMAKTSLLEEMNKLIPHSDEVLTSYDAFEKVKDLLYSLKINKSRPKPGHLHIASYQNGIYHNRPTVFVVGLDNRKFPGESMEDPLLLDKERIRLHSQLPLLSERGSEKVYAMLQLLAHNEGTVTVSYATFDINENRTVSPAHLLLQCYRLMSKNPSAQFKDLQQVSALSTLPAPIEVNDFWHSKLSSGHPLNISEDFLKLYSNINEGKKAVQARFTPFYSIYDGSIQIDEHIFDPRRNNELIMNAGKLETLAKCPYKYFLREILKVRSIEEPLFSANRWLDPATRGTLLHSIFELFYTKLIEEDRKPSIANHKHIILTIAELLINQQKGIMPPQNERVFEQEVQDIYHCCMIFLKEEEEHCENHSPLYLEYSFGIGDIAPALINLPTGDKLQVSGKIDRVDVSNSGKYHIIDYKTGSTFGYGRNEAFKGGRQLQHFIYALAIEQHLRLQAGMVSESSYYFPTPKGIGQRVIRNQNETLRTNGLDLLEKLIDVIKSGHFTMTDDKNDCSFCEYKKACKRSFYSDDIIVRKQMDPDAEGLTKFRGVRSYD